MKQLFNKNTLESNFIKGMLHNIAIPRYKCVTTGDFIINGIYYIYNSKIIYCFTTGYLGTDAEYEPLGPYDFGRFYPQFTEKFISKSDYYDTETHKWLGEYLRAYRDIRYVDMMPFYNCYCNDISNRWEIDVKNNTVEKVTKSNYKIIKIPIKFNETYTIAIDCPSEVKITCAFMDKDELVKSNIQGIQSKNVSTALWSLNHTTVSYPSLDYKNVITYRIDNIVRSNCYQLQMLEKYLTLLIQLPKLNNSSITVLEGDYSKLNSKKIIDAASVDLMTNAEVDNVMLSNLSLLMLNDRISHPFAEVLIQYLLGNVIDCSETIEENTKRIQNIIKNNTSLTNPVLGVWNHKLRKVIYDFIITNKKSSKIDMNGFVDLNTEKLIYTMNNKESTANG